MVARLNATVPRMAVKRMDHVGIVVDDLATAKEFFAALGLALQGEGSVEGAWADRVVGLEGIRSDLRWWRRRTGTRASS